MLVFKELSMRIALSILLKFAEVTWASTQKTRQMVFFPVNGDICIDNREKLWIKQNVAEIEFIFVNISEGLVWSSVYWNHLL